MMFIVLLLRVYLLDCSNIRILENWYVNGMVLQNKAVHLHDFLCSSGPYENTTIKILLLPQNKVVRLNDLRFFSSSSRYESNDVQNIIVTRLPPRLS